MTAQEYAASLRADSGIRWRALELAAFADHPSVLNQLDPRGRHHPRGRRLAPATLLLGLPAMLLLGAMFLAPVAGITTLIGDRFGRVHPDPVVAVPIATVLFLCTLPLLAVSAIRWIRGGRPRDQLREYQAGMLAVLGALSAVIALVRSAQEGFVDGTTWTIGIAIPTVLGAAFWVALLASRRRTNVGGSPVAPGAVTADRANAVEPLHRVREAVEKLPVAQQRVIRSDLDAAIHDLARRGIIRPEDVDRARAAELGKLALRMSQR